MDASVWPAEEGLLSWAERWSPEEASAWATWRDALTGEQRSEVLLPLQAALTGLAAYRQLENHPLSSTICDFRPHLTSVCAGYDWALDLVARLRPDLSTGQARQPRADDKEGEGPATSLRALEVSLTDGVRIARRLLELTVVDAGAFQASCDLFLRDLDRNPFFRPPTPLEFANVRELVHAESLTPALQSWQSDAARITTTVAFLTLVRAHRFLGIADTALKSHDGPYRAQLVIAAVRRELRAFTRFLMVQGVETLAQEFEQRLVDLDSHHVTGTYRRIRETTSELDELRSSLEGLAVRIHGAARTALDVPIGSDDASAGSDAQEQALVAGISAVRDAVKTAARDLRRMARPAPPELGQSDTTEAVLRDVWAFRFILRAFVDKAAAEPTLRDASEVPEFAKDFARHYRAFARRLLRAVEYARRGPLSRAVGALSGSGPGGEAVADAVHEAEALLGHLDLVLERQAASAQSVPFDKRAAAAELRAYLGASTAHRKPETVLVGVFGSRASNEAEAG